jgi:hypothetical protein
VPPHAPADERYAIAKINLTFTIIHARKLADHEIAIGWAKTPPAIRFKSFVLLLAEFYHSMTRRN